MMGDGIVQVQLYGYHLTFLISLAAPSVRFVETAEECLPGFLCRCLSRQLHNSLRYHGISLLLVVPAVFYPQACVTVPFRHTRRVNPCHTARVYATTDAYGVVGVHEQSGEGGVDVSKEHSVSVYRLVKQLDGGRWSKVRILPSTKFPDFFAALVDFYSLNRSVGSIHRCLVPFVIPVIDDMSAILQANSLLRLGDAIVCRIHLPYRHPLTVYLLYLTLSACYEQIATLGHLLY